MIKEINPADEYGNRYRYNDGVMEWASAGQEDWTTVPRHVVELTERDIREGRFKVIEPVQPKAEPRYFVHTGRFGTAKLDHVRNEGSLSYLVYEDGEEDGNCYWPIAECERAVRDGSWKEVFPKDSDSLRRAHKYAAMYSQGKEAGYRDGLLAGRTESERQAREKYEQGWEAGRLAGITEGKAAIETTESYQRGVESGMLSATTMVKNSIFANIVKDIDEAVGNGSRHGYAK